MLIIQCLTFNFYLLWVQRLFLGLLVLVLELSRRNLNKSLLLWLSAVWQKNSPAFYLAVYRQPHNFTCFFLCIVFMYSINYTLFNGDKFSLRPCLRSYHSDNYCGHCLNCLAAKDDEDGIRYVYETKRSLCFSASLAYDKADGLRKDLASLFIQRMRDNFDAYVRTSLCLSYKDYEAFKSKHLSFCPRLRHVFVGDYDEYTCLPRYRCLFFVDFGDYREDFICDSSAVDDFAISFRDMIVKCWFCDVLDFMRFDEHDCFRFANYHLLSDYQYSDDCFRLFSCDIGSNALDDEVLLDNVENGRFYVTFNGHDYPIPGYIFKRLNLNI